MWFVMVRVFSLFCMKMSACNCFGVPVHVESVSLFAVLHQMGQLKYGASSQQSAAVPSRLWVVQGTLQWTASSCYPRTQSTL